MLGERLLVSKRVTQKFYIERLSPKGVNGVEGQEQYQSKILNNSKIDTLKTMSTCYSGVLVPPAVLHCVTT
jgi:hypothetical protein